MKLSIVFLIFLASLLFGCSSPSAITDEAQAYTVTSKEDFSFRGRTRIQFNIVAPEASAFEQYAHTAMEAAIEKQKETKAEVVSIFLDPTPQLAGTGSAYAIARYAPDGGGYSGDQGWTWEVEAVKKPFADREVEISELWWSNRNQYQKDGLTDEPRLKAFIAKKMNIAVESVSLPWVTRSKYQPVIE